MPATTVLLPQLFQGTSPPSDQFPWDPAKKSIIAKAALSDAVVQDPNARLTLIIWLSFNGGDVGGSYIEGPSAVWQGGQADARNPGSFIVPSVGVSFNQSQALPTHAKLQLVSPTTVSAGGTLEQLS